MRLVDAVRHIAAWSRFDGWILDISRCRRCRPRPAPVTLEPLAPQWPPTALLFLRCRQPGVRIGRIRRTAPVAASILRRRIDHACDVAARAQNEHLVTCAEELEAAICGAPRNDVVVARGEHEARQRD